MTPVLLVLPFQTHSTGEIYQLQMKDPAIRPVYVAVKKGKLPHDDEISVRVRGGSRLFYEMGRSLRYPQSGGCNSSCETCMSMKCFVVFPHPNRCTRIKACRQFESELLKQICNLLQIKKTHTTPYRPQGNGMVERFNRTLQDMLAIAVGNYPADWEVYIRKLCFAYNTSVHSSTGYSPFFLMFGRQATIPIDLMFPLDKEQQKEVPEYVHQLREGLQAAYSLVRERVIPSTRDRRLYTIEESMADRSTEEIMCGSSRLQSPLAVAKSSTTPGKGRL